MSLLRRVMVGMLIALIPSLTLFYAAISPAASDNNNQSPQNRIPTRSFRSIKRWISPDRVPKPATDQHGGEPIRYRHSQLFDRHLVMRRDGRAGRDEADRDEALDVAYWAGKEVFWLGVAGPAMIDGKPGWVLADQRDAELYLLQAKISNSRDKKPKEQLAELQRLERDLQQWLEEQLKPEQIDQLHQLAWRHACDRYTLYQLLTVGALGEELEVTNDQREELTVAVIAEIDRLRVDFLNLEIELFEKAIEGLDPAQQEKVRNRYSDRDLWRRMPLIDFQRIEDNLRLTSINQSTVAELFQNSQDASDESKFNMGNAVPMFDPQVGLGEFSHLIELDPEEQAVHAKRYQELGLRAAQLIELLHGEREEPLSAKQVQEYRREYRELREEMVDVNRRSISGPAKFEWERIEDLQKLRYLGVTNLLSCGSLGQEIEIRAEQADEVVKKSLELRSFVRTRRIEILESHHQRIAELLTTQQQEQLIDSLGSAAIIMPEPREYIGSLETLISYLPQHWEGIEIRLNSRDRKRERIASPIPRNTQSQ